MFSFTALAAFALLAVQVNAHGALSSIQSDTGGYIKAPNVRHFCHPLFLHSLRL